MRPKSHKHPMASNQSILDFSDENSKKLDMNSIRELVTIINHNMQAILENKQALKALKVKCTSKLKIQSQEFFEFSEHSVLSNLYWGIENIEAAAQAKSAQERTIKLENSEKMLQIPASLDENGSTLGVSNSYLICFSYFYLSVVEFLRKNEGQVAVHFLQAVLVAPRLVRTLFAPGICQALLFRYRFERLSSIGRTDDETFDDFDDGTVDDAMRWIAGTYKPWLMYYQVMDNGDFRQGNGVSLAYDEELVQPPNCEEIISSDKKIVPYSGKSCSGGSNIKRCLKDILTETDSEPVTPISLHSYNSSSTEDLFPQDYAENGIASMRSRIDHQAPALNKGVNETKVVNCISGSFSTSFCGTDTSALGLRKLNHYLDGYTDQEEKLEGHHYIGSFASKSYRNSFSRITRSLSCHPQHEEDMIIEQSGLLEKIVSKLCFTEEFGNSEQEYTVEMNTIYEILNSKSGLKYSLLKDIILDQLLTAISTSKEERVVRTSLVILSTIVTTNRSVIEDIKAKGLQLYDLATALKRNVHEAVILIYLINPSPAEIKTLELLPCLVEVVCTSKSYKVELTSLPLTPPAASLMIIEVLVTAFDCETNTTHLAAISSPRVLSELVQVPRKDNLDEFLSLASILVKCMRFDGKCREHISEFCPVAPFVSLLWSNHKRTTVVALEFFNELLRMPRSSAVGFLERIHKQGSSNNMCALFLLTQKSEPEYRLLAANLFLQLEILEDEPAKCLYMEEATEALLESLMCEESPATQALSAFILSNVGGTYSWTGEPYTIAWLVKKTGLALGHHKNLIKNYDFLDQSLQDTGIDSWSSKIAQRILNFGNPLFHALDKGLKSKLKRVSRDCLVATAWLGCELVKGPEELRHAACEIVLQSIEQFVHPGSELEERLLACLCIYNYTSGRGMRKIVNLSEGVRESLRRLSNVTWMAEELLKVADYFQPNKWRISCVHSQILEVGNKRSGAVTALIYYRGQLCSGYADGSIKVWDIKGQITSLAQEIKEHKKAVTCFAHYEPGNCLLSGSADRTIKKWRMLQGNLDCIEVIPVKESIRSMDSWGEMIFVTTGSHKLKVIDASRKIKDIFKNKRVKCVRASQGKVYVGCTDSSIQELMITNNRQQDIKGPSKSWLQNKPISSVAIHKDWLYSASSAIEGSKIKAWRTGSRPQISIAPERGARVLAMEVVEDFIYLNCTTSMNNIQIWLRGTQHKVGRLSAGSKITSLLTANDMVLCGTEKGMIKGWIPL